MKHHKFKPKALEEYELINMDVKTLNQILAS